VRRTILAAGRQLRSDGPVEPMIAYRPLPKDRTGSGWAEVRFRAERAVWRDSTALFTAVHRGGGGQNHPRPRVPRALLQLGDLVQYGCIPRGRTYRVVLCGIVGDRARIDLWREEHIPVVAAYFEDPDMSSYLHQALEAGERAGYWISVALRLKPKDEPLLVQLTASALRYYWAQLEPRFLRLVDGLGRAAVEDGEWLQADAELSDWLATVATTARAAFDRAVATIEFNRRFAAEITKARGHLDRKLARLKGGRGE